ncbi:MAG: uracil phosphoribosyltransferase [Armatimonadetes bacterium 13_1_40CM_3_65_7]|nr:MAG: uracil phosphoribosyltransferase [Armatimonadetes bacterium 13_1_40CM_3_65_7]
MGQVRVFDHPLIQHKLTILRDRRTGHKEFRELVEEVAMLMAFEATSDLPIRTVEVTTPLAPARGATLAGREIAVVPILRAGLAMETGILRLIPTARVGHIGIFRDPASLEPRTYYCKLPPDIADRQVLVLDPMLATGGSAVEAVGLLKGRGARVVRLMVLIAAPEGVRRFQAGHPDVDIYTAAVDERLDDHGYILPGLGDAGDRLYGTR